MTSQFGRTVLLSTWGCRWRNDHGGRRVDFSLVTRHDVGEIRCGDVRVATCECARLTRNRFIHRKTSQVDQELTIVESSTVTLVQILCHQNCAGFIFGSEDRVSIQGHPQQLHVGATVVDAARNLVVVVDSMFLWVTIARVKHLSIVPCKTRHKCTGCIESCIHSVMTHLRLRCSQWQCTD